MSDSTRRGFLGMAGAGAVAVGTAAVAPAALADDAPWPRVGGRSTEPVVAYVQDVSKGELALMVGEREVVVQDRDLVNRILNAAGR
jgi:hypothetical protein